MSMLFSKLLTVSCCGCAPYPVLCRVVATPRLLRNDQYKLKEDRRTGFCPVLRGGPPDPIPPMRTPPIYGARPSCTTATRRNTSGESHV